MRWRDDLNRENWVRRGNIFAEVNYLGAMDDAPITYGHDQSAGNLVLSPHRVELHDLRSTPPGSSFGERGVTLAHIPFDWPGDEAVAAHLPSIERVTWHYNYRRTALHIVRIGM